MNFKGSIRKYFYLALFAVTFLVTVSAYSQSTCKDIFAEQRFGRTSITKVLSSFLEQKAATDLLIEKNDFTKDRKMMNDSNQDSYESYDSIFLYQLYPYLLKLHHGSHIVEVGSAEGAAIFQWLIHLQSLGLPLPDTTSINVITPDTYEVNKLKAKKSVDLKNHRLLKGRYLEDIPISEIGLADIVLDIYAALSYSPYFAEVLTKELWVLKPGRRLFTVLGTRTTFQNENGNTLTNKDFFKRVKGVRWIELHSLNVVVLERTEDPIEVPNVELLEYESSTPPYRTYKIRPH